MSWPAALGGRGRGGPGPVTDVPVIRRPQWSGPVASDVVLPPAGDEAVRELARAGLARFHGQGIHLEIVRSRPKCLVVRSTVHAQVDGDRARAFVNEWLGSLPRLAHQVEGTVVESTTTPADGRRAIHTLLWRAGVPPVPPIEMSPPAPPPPAALGSPTPPAPPGGALRAPPPPAAGSPGGVPTAPAPPSFPDSAGPTPRVTRAQNGIGVERALVAKPRRDGVGHHRRAGDRPPPSGLGDAPGLGTVLAGGTAFGDRGNGVPTPAGESGAGPHFGRRWAWLRRRGWMLALGMVAGAVGGLAAGGQGAPTYSATSVLVVQSGASTTGPGSANDAEELATTYAALIPEDQQLIDQTARALGTTPAAVSGHLQVVAESGTSLLQLHYSDANPIGAVRGANEVARLLTSTTPPGHAIPAGSVAVVSPPAGASRSGSLHKYGLPLGVLLGLLVGLVAAMVAERVDRRVDDLEGLGDGVGCPVTALPGGISAAELAAALQREVDPPVTVVPLRSSQSAAASELAQELSAAWPARLTRPAVGVGPVFAEAPEALGTGDGATVVVVGTGERLGVVHEMAERLRLVGRGPAWAVLDVGVPKRALRGHEG
jgi:capsular polysaccharide biosynthesis protein